MTKTTIRPMCELIVPHLRHMEQRGLRATTIEDRGTVLRRADAELPLGLLEATVSDLDNWLAGPPLVDPEDTGWCNQTKATYYGHLVGFYTWACEGDDPWLDWNPSSSLKRPRVPAGVPNPISDEELGDILGRAENPFRVWLVLAAYSGMRPIEIARIQRADITEEAIRIRDGKGGKHAVLPTHPEIWRAVKDLPPGPVATNRFGRPVNATFISSRTGMYLRKRLGIYGVGCRRLRHWYGTTALHVTDNLRVVQELMRHSSPATTAIYTQITSEQRRTAVQALPAPRPESS